MNKFLPFKLALTLFGLAAVSFVSAQEFGDVSFSMDTAEGCAPFTVNFTNTSNDGQGFFWDFDDGNDTTIIGKGPASHTFSSPGTFKVQLVAVDLTGNPVGLKNEVVTVYGITNIYGSQGMICPGEQVYFYTPGVGDSYDWDFGDGSTSTNPDETTHVFADTGSYTIRLIVESQCGTDTAYWNLTVSDSASPSANIYVDAEVACPGEAFNFEVDGPRQSTSMYDWDFGDGVQKSGAEVSYVFPDTGLYLVELAVTNSCGQTNVDSVKVSVVDTASLPDMFVLSFPGCPGDPTTLFVADGSEAFRYDWDFGDGNSKSKGANVEYHPYDSVGTYNVSVIVTNGCGDKDTLASSINVGDSVTPSLSSDDWGLGGDGGGEYCPGDSVLFYSVTNLGTMIFDFGDGTTDTASQLFEVEDGFYVYIINHAYADTGDYTVTITALNGCGLTDSDSLTVTIGGNSPVLAEVGIGNPGGNNQNFSACEEVSLYALGAQRYIWEFSDGSARDTTYGFTHSHTYTEPGNYTLFVGVKNGCGSEDTLVETVTILGMDLDVNEKHLVCGETWDGEAITTVNNGVGPYTYAWSNGATTKDLMNLGGGEYELTVTDANGCTVTDTAFIWAPDTLWTMDTSRASTCGNTDGMAGVVVSGGVEPYTYTWGGGETTDTIGGLPAGNYSVMVEDSIGCKTGINVSLTDADGHMIDTITHKDVACYGDTNTGFVMVTISGGTAPYTYQWETGDTITTDSLWIKGDSLAPGTYNLTIVDSNDCVASASGMVNEPPMILVPINLEAGDVLKTAPFTTYQWYANDTMISGATSQMYTVLETGIYFVTVTDSNGCASESDTLHVTVGGIVGDPELRRVLKVYPNPYSDFTNINYSLSKEAEVVLEVFSLVGERLTVLVSQTQTPGTYNYTFSASELGYPNGVYIVRLSTGNIYYTTRLVEIK